MDQETSNLFRRRDTFFGVCEGIGQDFGFNPLWLRLAFIAPIFFFPVQAVAGYLALGVVVFASRKFYPAATAPTASAADATPEPAADEREMALAA